MADQSKKGGGFENAKQPSLGLNWLCFTTNKKFRGMNGIKDVSAFGEGETRVDSGMVVDGKISSGGTTPKQAYYLVLD